MSVPYRELLADLLIAVEFDSFSEARSPEEQAAIQRAWNELDPDEEIREWEASRVRAQTETFVVPIEAPSLKRKRSRWEIAKLTKKQRRTTLLTMLAAQPKIRPPCQVRITKRIARGPMLDDDNLARALSAVRDEIAAFFGVSDAPDSPVRWSYHQEPATGHGDVLVELRKRPRLEINQAITEGART